METVPGVPRQGKMIISSMCMLFWAYLALSLSFNLICSHSGFGGSGGFMGSDKGEVFVFVFVLKYWRRWELHSPTDKPALGA